MTKHDDSHTTKRASTHPPAHKADHDATETRTARATDGTLGDALHQEGIEADARRRVQPPTTASDPASGEKSPQEKREQGEKYREVKAEHDAQNKQTMDQKLAVAQRAAMDPNLDVGLVANLQDKTQKPAWNMTVTAFDPPPTYPDGTSKVEGREAVAREVKASVAKDDGSDAGQKATERKGATSKGGDDDAPAAKRH